MNVSVDAATAAKSVETSVPGGAFRVAKGETGSCKSEDDVGSAPKWPALPADGEKSVPKVGAAALTSGRNAGRMGIIRRLV